MPRTATHPLDIWLLSILVALTATGFLVFLSASVGLLAREGASFSQVILTRSVAVALGAIAAYLLSRLDYRFFRRHALLFLFFSIFLAVLVFVPGIGVEHGGARRWLNIFGVSFQPSEFLKFIFVIYAAAFFSGVKGRIATFSWGLLPLFLLLALAGLLLLLEPDTDTFAVLFFALLALFFVAGGRVRQLALPLLCGIIALSFLIAARPYLKERFLTFLNPGGDPQGAGWQIQQSLIAIGSGGFTGRGFGQSVQKFSYLPEPIGDSIFAVAGEEFGFIGTSIFVALFLAFLLRGFHVAARAPDVFARLLAVGIVILIGAAAFINIASMLGLIPLSGLTLPLVSHGGTSLVMTLASSGILLNISRHQRI